MKSASDGPLRIGIVGTGFIGTTVGSQFNDDDRSTVAALTDVDKKSLSQGAEILDVPPPAQYHDYETMLNSEDLDAVLLGTPHSLHYQQVVAAMDSGLHVLCDKPLTIGTDTAKDLVERSEASEQVLMVGYQRHLSPAFITAREYLSASDAAPRHFTAEITQPWGGLSDESSWRANPDISGGGFLYDTGSHLIDAVLWIIDRHPTHITADMDFYDENQRMDRRAVITVKFGNGIAGTITTSTGIPIVREHLYFYDSEGGVFIDGRGWNERRVRVVDSDNGEYHPSVGGEGHHQNKARAFLDAVIDDTEPPATARDGFRAIAVKEAAYRSARANERIKLDPL